MRFRKYIIQIFFAYLLTGCTTANEKLLSSLLYFEGCTSVCWVGIEVGKSSFHQAQKILEDRYTDQNTDLLPYNIMIWRINRVDSSYGTVSFSKGVVDGVQLFFEERQFTAKNAIKVLGEPTNVMISIDRTGSSRRCLGMQLSHSQTGVMVYLDTTQVSKGVEASQSVTGFWFRSPEDLQNMQLDVQNDGISIVTEWQGYKDYCEAISE